MLEEDDRRAAGSWLRPWPLAWLLAGPVNCRMPFRLFSGSRDTEAAQRAIATCEIVSLRLVGRNTICRTFCDTQGSHRRFAPTQFTSTLLAQLLGPIKPSQIAFMVHTSGPTSSLRGSLQRTAKRLSCCGNYTLAKRLAMTLSTYSQGHLPNMPLDNDTMLSGHYMADPETRRLGVHVVCCANLQMGGPRETWFRS